jgi:hypothetical protein
MACKDAENRAGAIEVWEIRRWTRLPALNAFSRSVLESPPRLMPLALAPIAVNSEVVVPNAEAWQNHLATDPVAQMSWHCAQAAIIKLPEPQSEKAKE